MGRGCRNIQSRSLGLTPCSQFKLLLLDLPPRYALLKKKCRFLNTCLGARSCIGRKFAETEVKCVLAVLLNKYQFDEVVPGRPVEKETILTVRPKGGMPLRITSICTQMINIFPRDM